MTTDAMPSAMRRKAGAGRPPPEIGQITAAKALRGAVVQAAEEVAGLVAITGAVTEARTTLAPLEEALPEHPLLGLVEGAGGRFGLVILDAQVVAALIEMQTTGRVAPRPVEARAPTRTDAILCADFIDRTLELFEARVAEADLPLAPALTGFRYALALAEARAIALTLEDVAYRQFSVPLDLGRGAKTGEMRLVLPFDPPGAGAHTGVDGAGFSEALRVRVLEAEVQLSATLARCEMALADVTRIAVGAVIPLPGEGLAGVVIEDLHGRVVARGRLGRADGHRAVRIARPGVEAMQTAAAGPAGEVAMASGDPSQLATALAEDAGDSPASLSDLPGLTPLPDRPELAALGAPGDPAKLSA
jgi:flagellar motor switch protein FliM